jgi:hypothetical protein
MTKEPAHAQIVLCLLRYDKVDSPRKRAKTAWNALPRRAAHHDSVFFAFATWRATLSGRYSCKILNFPWQAPRQLACLSDPIVRRCSDDERYSVHCQKQNREDQDNVIQYCITIIELGARSLVQIV